MFIQFLCGMWTILRKPNLCATQSGHAGINNEDFRIALSVNSRVLRDWCYKQIMAKDVQALTEMIQKFCEARDWDQFHPPKDLAIGISTEANELLDLFRFKNDQQVQEKLKDPAFRVKVSEELADVFFFVLRFAQMNSIDLSQALEDKMQKNGQKYPVETSKGSNRKYNE